MKDATYQSQRKRENDENIVPIDILMLKLHRSAKLALLLEYKL